MALGNLQATANIFGRGTAAGDAIYRCYARPTKESTLDPELLARLQKLRSEREAAEAAMIHPKPVPKSKAMISRPRVGIGYRMTGEERAKRRLEAIPHKKKETVIYQEMRARSPIKPPQFSRKPLTLAEKERLGQIFQFGELPPKPVRFTGANRVRYAAMDKRFHLKDRFETLKKQVDDLREELLQVKEQQKELRQRPVASEHAEGDKTVGEVVIPGIGIRQGFNRRDPLKSLELRLIEQEISRSIGDALREMREVDADICDLNENEAKRYDLSP
ncbi:hypothetical protein DQ04_01721080 [Trypanosoma grayi]|uniref:hypothetical protein n=1 Tax=Trypanosoma grayi TaxID=71804 RepID=UPI0004F43F3F|nr:hypothetical protein DQ04_01721080 [Trypanosoma grayi]KEG12433.1 hypothetical protein DQ04_01721080 [Trypanosoma grayi]